MKASIKKWKKRKRKKSRELEEHYQEQDVPPKLTRDQDENLMLPNVL